MKNLGFKSKNILAILLVIIFTIIIDYAIGQVFFSLAGGTIALAPGLIKLDKPSGCNMAGIATTAYVIDVNDIQTFPSVTDPAITPDQLVTYNGDFTLKPGKRWVKMYSTKEMGDLVSELDGPTDGKFFRNKASFFYPSTSAFALGMMTIFKEAEVVVILREFSGGGQMRVIGDEWLPASIAGSENSGKAFGDEKGITYLVESANCKPAMVYSGAISTTDDPYVFTETEEEGTPAQHVDGYENITGWNKNSYASLYFDVDDGGTMKLRAFLTEADRDAAVNPVFYVDAGTSIVVEQNTSGFAGSLAVVASPSILVGDEFYVTAT